MDIAEIVGRAWKARSLVRREGMRFLCEIAQSAPDGIGVEIGVFCGASLIAWSLARDGRGMCYGVDNWSYPLDFDCHATALQNLTRAESPAKLLTMTSREAADHITEPVAFVHIDGDHMQPSVEADIALWSPKIMPGGVIAFHDYGYNTRASSTPAVDGWQQRDPWLNLGCTVTMIGFRIPA